MLSEIQIPKQLLSPFHRIYQSWETQPSLELESRTGGRGCKAKRQWETKGRGCLKNTIFPAGFVYDPVSDCLKDCPCLGSEIPLVWRGAHKTQGSN